MRRPAPLVPWVALAAAISGCHCDGGRPRPDAGRDAEAEAGDAGADGDADADGRDDADPDADADQDLDELVGPETGPTEELCGDGPDEWSWQPFECPELDPPADCCPSCRRLTCREGAGGREDLWGHWAAYGLRGSVGLVDLETGSDQLVFVEDEESSPQVSYVVGALCDSYLLAHRLSVRDGRFAGATVVARPLADLSAAEIVLDPEPQREVVGIDAFDEWACWGRIPDATGVFEVVLHNIETGEQRVLDDESGGYDLDSLAIWGDRVVWTDSRGRLREHRISTGETRTVLEDLELRPMGSLSVWESQAVFTHMPHDAPWQVYLVDLETGEARRLSPSSGSQEMSFIHGARVVWSDYRGSSGGPAGMHVRVHSLRTGREYVLNPSARGGTNPVIFDRTILWAGGPEPEGTWVTRIADI